MWDFSNICKLYFDAGIPFGSVNLMHGVDENESKAKPLCIYVTLLTFYFSPILDNNIGLISKTTLVSVFF